MKGKYEGFSEVTKKAMKDFIDLTEQEFLNKYFCTKKRYACRVAKYGDPINGIIPKIGKIFNCINKLIMKN